MSLASVELRDCFGGFENIKERHESSRRRLNLIFQFGGFAEQSFFFFFFFFFCLASHSEDLYSVIHANVQIDLPRINIALDVLVEVQSLWLLWSLVLLNRVMSSSYPEAEKSAFSSKT
jgi:hypothetical protein